MVEENVYRFRPLWFSNPLTNFEQYEVVWGFRVIWRLVCGLWFGDLVDLVVCFFGYDGLTGCGSES